MQTDDDCPEVKTDTQKPSTDNVDIYEDKPNFDVQNKAQDVLDDRDVTLEASNVAFPPDLDTSFSDVQENDDNEQKATEDVTNEVMGTTKRRRRPKRYSKVDDDGVDISDMPAELQGEPKMIKYWRKRHSLFHRYIRFFRGFLYRNT